MPHLFTASTEAHTTPPFQLSILRWIPREDYFQIAPETISERLKSWGSMPPDPPRWRDAPDPPRWRASRMNTPIAKILGSPLLVTLTAISLQHLRGLRSPFQCSSSGITCLSDWNCRMSRWQFQTATTATEFERQNSSLFSKNANNMISYS